MLHAYNVNVDVDENANAPSVHDQIAQGLREHPAKKGLPFNLLVTVLEIGGSITLFHVAKRMGASGVVSYLVGSIAPCPRRVGYLDQGPQVQRSLGRYLHVHFRVRDHCLGRH
jgi:hypothetical protein